MMVTGSEYLFWVLKSRAGTTFKHLNLPVSTRQADPFCEGQLLVLSKQRVTKELAGTGPGHCLSKTALALQQPLPFLTMLGPSSDNRPAPILNMAGRMTPSQSVCVRWPTKIAGSKGV